MDFPESLRSDRCGTMFEDPGDDKILPFLLLEDQQPPSMQTDSVNCSHQYVRPGLGFAFKRDQMGDFEGKLDTVTVVDPDLDRTRHSELRD